MSDQTYWAILTLGIIQAWKDKHEKLVKAQRSEEYYLASAEAYLTSNAQRFKEWSAGNEALAITVVAEIRELARND